MSIEGPQVLGLRPQSGCLALFMLDGLHFAEQNLVVFIDFNPPIPAGHVEFVFGVYEVGLLRGLNPESGLHGLEPFAVGLISLG